MNIPIESFESLNTNEIKKKIDLLIESEAYGDALSQLSSWMSIHDTEWSLYAYVGLTYLLMGHEEEAQTAWMTPYLMLEASEDVEDWISQVTSLLKKESIRQQELGKSEVAWLLCQHQYSFLEDDISTPIHLIQAAIEFGVFSDQVLKDCQLNHPEIKREEIDLDWTLAIIEKVLKNFDITISTLEFLESWAVVFQMNSEKFVYLLMRSAIDFASRNRWLDPSIRLSKLAFKLEPGNGEVLGHLSGFYYSAQMYDEGIEVALQFMNCAEQLPYKIHAYSMLMRGLMGKGGEWAEVIETFQANRFLFSRLFNSSELELNQTTTSCLFNAAFFDPYIFDNPKETRQLQNQISAICQSVTSFYESANVEKYQQRHNFRQASATGRRLKIGYLCHCFRSHSVGWLARWLIQNHDRNNFDVYGYFVAYRFDSPDQLQESYVEIFENPRKFGVNAQEIAEAIYTDDLDLLIDLDSITLDISYEVMAMKPAPIQATWLGLDASGLNSIDYFIADPYVLPSDADSYYNEKIFRLPDTYLAVDGFEIGIPSLTRQILEIPEQSIIYLTCQSGLKRNIDMVRSQMKIIHAVPDSYLLIKGFADQKSITTLFEKIACEEGIRLDRLRFLENTTSEAVHRANLRIADIVLDTYPYNGATTTMETLWMEVPIVTRVGQQFAARNSYTMMMNAGITEGIAWSAEEYVEWGIKLGTNAQLRQDVSWKLRQSKQTSPLWNGKQFTRQMEDAYQQMWAIYQQQHYGLEEL